MKTENEICFLYVGLDVAKQTLQVDLSGNAHTLNNNDEGHSHLLKLLQPYAGAHVICEATGGYEQRVARFLQATGVPVTILEASRARSFAKAQGQRAKTDPIDAAMLTAYGKACTPNPTPPASTQQQHLAEVVRRRHQLVQLLTIERCQAGHFEDQFRQCQARQIILLLKKQIEQCVQTAFSLINGDPILKQRAERLQSIRGVGPVVAITILAEVPELGTLNRYTAAALAGVAPYNRASGTFNGRRRIGGGRSKARRALFMATLTAVRYDSILREFYLRLVKNGKQRLVAITACMRKLIVLMNRLLKDDQFKLYSDRTSE